MNRAQVFIVTLALAVAAFSIPGFAKAKVVYVFGLKDSQGKNVGTVSLSQKGPAVNVELKLHDLTPGEHAIHFHQVPKCEAPDFKSAGGHFNPDSKKHGFDSPDGHHAGDMKNFTVDAQGNAKKIRFQTTDVSLTDGPHSVFANGGTAIVIHAKGDDYKTDPSGNSGDRIACGVITK